MIIILGFDSGQIAGYNLSVDTVGFCADVECFSEVADGGWVELMNFDIIQGFEGMKDAEMEVAGGFEAADDFVVFGEGGKELGEIMPALRGIRVFGRGYDRV